MTAIAGFCENGKVFIGGDSAGVAGWALTIRSDPKVFKNDGFIFGFTSSFRMGQLLRYSFAPPSSDSTSDLMAYMCSTFIDAVRNCLKAGGFATKEKEVESAGTFLVGHRGRLFCIDGDYQVQESSDGYDACGCARDIVLGAFHATRDLKMAGIPRIKLALSAAEHHSAGVRGPFIVDSV